jgi:maleate isomerase
LLRLVLTRTNKHAERLNMGTKSTEVEVVRAFETKLAELLKATRASRVTLRLDLPKYGFHVNDVAAEARQHDVASLKRQTSIDQRRAPTVMWLERERRILVQRDLVGADPACPPELMQIYGTLAQMLAPLVRADELIGWISVHHTGGPRDWQPNEVDALSQTAGWFTRWLEQDEPISV